MSTFDEATRDLLTGDSAATRALAARKLEVFGNSLATPHLITALSDSAPEVRRAAVEVLGHLGDAAAIDPLNALLRRETSEQVPETAIQHAIYSIAMLETKTRRRSEEERLRLEREEEALRRAIEELARRRGEVEAARRKAEEESRRLREEREQIQA